MLVYGATMFLSAFLLFLIQPLIGKFILPWFGGTPAVWTTCMLFFQALLLVGYGYAHALASRWSLRRQALIHGSLVTITVAAVLYLSIFPSAAWKPVDGGFPVLRILGLLLVSIGAPYFLLSATAPLMQSWFSRTHPATSPYRLYALSNLGSMIAILSYPLLIEPAISLSRQGSIWAWLYAAFAAMCLLIALKTINARMHDSAGAAGSRAEDDGDTPPGPGRYFLWLALTACSSVMLLATTSMMCQDLAVVPLLWILPLALYLLSFVLCFQHEKLYWRPLFVGGLTASVAWTCFVLFGGVFVALRWQILSYSLTLFTSCMVCHGELVRLKPGSRHLTSFYLMIAGGGSLGGFLVTVIAPRVLRGYFEYHVGLLATVLLLLAVLFRERSGALHHGRPAAVWGIWILLAAAWCAVGFLVYDRIWQYRNFYLGLSSVILVTAGCLWADSRRLIFLGRPVRVWTVWAGLITSWCVLALVLVNHIQESIGRTVETSRNFFGVLRVQELYKEDPEEHSFSLMHGRIEHGFQFQDPEKRRWRTSYYGPASGIGLAIGFHPRRLEGDSLRIGVIGLGAGALAAWGEPGDYIRFYEINPEVLRLSDKYFTYRRDSPARNDVVLGDARISLEREQQGGVSEQFDVLAMDAFTGDAIPVHLLTRECFQDYLYHLKEDGILAIHITNRYFDLSPVVRNLIVPGTHRDMQAVWIHDLGDMTQSTDRTDWVLLTANARFLANRNIQRRITPWPDPVPPPRFWTDDYSDLFSLIHERINER